MRRRLQFIINTTPSATHTLQSFSTRLYGSSIMKQIPVGLFHCPVSPCLECLPLTVICAVYDAPSERADTDTPARGRRVAGGQLSLERDRDNNVIRHAPARLFINFCDVLSVCLTKNTMASVSFFNVPH